MIGILLVLWIDQRVSLSTSGNSTVFCLVEIHETIGFETDGTQEKMGSPGKTFNCPGHEHSSWVAVPPACHADILFCSNRSTAPRLNADPA